MKNAISIIALIVAGISVWLVIDWKKVYSDCDKKKQECYSGCRATWDAERAITNREVARLDSLEEAWNSDTLSAGPLNLGWLRASVADQKLDDFIAYMKCKEACDKAWLDCVGE